MIREQKIEALAEEYVAMAYNDLNDKAIAKLAYYYGALAGIALRDAELLETVNSEAFKEDLFSGEFDKSPTPEGEKEGT